MDQKIKNEVKVQVAELQSKMEAKIKNMKQDMQTKFSELRSDIQEHLSNEVKEIEVKAEEAARIKWLKNIQSVLGQELGQDITGTSTQITSSPEKLASLKRKLEHREEEDSYGPPQKTPNRSMRSIRDSFPEINQRLENLAIMSKYNTNNNEMRPQVQATVEEMNEGELPKGTNTEIWFNRYRKLAGFLRRYKEDYEDLLTQIKENDSASILREITKRYKVESPSSSCIPKEFGSFLLQKAKELQ